jgi:pyridinium-3,5-biscarboxylic acid mononucleotide synthase
MPKASLRNILDAVATQRLPVDQALEQLAWFPFEDISFAKLDHQRPLRQGFPEVIYAPGKTPSQLKEIARKLYRKHSLVLITRIEKTTADYLRRQRLPVLYEPEAHIVVITNQKPPIPQGLIVILTAGTVDIPVAEEARVVATWMGAKVTMIHDVGVAGIHRLLAHTETLR